MVCSCQCFKWQMDSNFDLHPFLFKASHTIHKRQLDSFKSSKQKTCLSNIAKQLSCSMLSAAVFRSRSKSSNIVSKYVRVPSFHLLYNSNLLD